MTRALRAVNWPGLAVIAGIIVVWHVVVATGTIDFEYVPGPVPVAEAIGELAASGALLTDFVHSFSVILVSSAIAIVVGVAIGSAIGLIATVRNYTVGTVDVLRSIPFVALVPLTVLIWGPETYTEIIIASYSAMWNVIINTSNAYQRVSPRLNEVARTFELSGTERFVKITFPAIIPQVLVGARLAVITAMVVTILAETFVNPAGLGWSLVLSQMSLQPDVMWAYAVVIGLIGYVLNVALVHGVRALAPGGRHNPELVGS